MRKLTLAILVVFIVVISTFSLLGKHQDLKPKKKIFVASRRNSASVNNPI